MDVLSLEPMRVIQNKKGEYHFSDILQCLIILYLLYCHFWSKLADFTDVFIRGCSVFDISIYHRNDVVNGNGMIHNLVSSIIGSDGYREVVNAPLVLYQNPRFEFAKVECRSILDDLDACEFG